MIDDQQCEGIERRVREKILRKADKVTRKKKSLYLWSLLEAYCNAFFFYSASRISEYLIDNLTNIACNLFMFKEPRRSIGF
jgi:hypothetical protein